eukprot:scaffold1444_cov164-Pinguiococcus_pyrenoidosus.AAC.2
MLSTRKNWRNWKNGRDGKKTMTKFFALRCVCHSKNDTFYEPKQCGISSLITIRVQMKQSLISEFHPGPLGWNFQLFNLPYDARTCDCQLADKLSFVRSGIYTRIRR